MKIHNHMTQSFRKHSLTTPYEAYGGDDTGWAMGEREDRDRLGSCCCNFGGDEVRHGVNGAVAERVSAMLQKEKWKWNCGSLDVRDKGEEGSPTQGSDST